MEIDSNRLDRIEKKIDELGEAFVIMARVEEKIVNLEQARIESNRRYDDTVTTLLVEIKEVKNKQIVQDKMIIENARITKNIVNAAWITFTAVAGSLAAWALTAFA